MNSENLEMLKGLIKVKKFHLLEMEKNNANYTDPVISDTRNNIMQINSMEIRFLRDIVKEEEKHGA